MGFETIRLHADAAKKRSRGLGAHHYIDSQTADVGAELQRLGGVTVALSTVTAASAMLPVLQGLAIDGELLVVGASAEALPVNTAAMIGGRHATKA